VTRLVEVKDHAGLLAARLLEPAATTSNWTPGLAPGRSRDPASARPGPRVASHAGDGGLGPRRSTIRSAKSRSAPLAVWRWTTETGQGPADQHVTVGRRGPRAQPRALRGPAARRAIAQGVGPGAVRGIRLRRPTGNPADQHSRGHAAITRPSCPLRGADQRDAASKPLGRKGIGEARTRSAHRPPRTLSSTAVSTRGRTSKSPATPSGWPRSNADEGGTL